MAAQGTPAQNVMHGSLQRYQHWSANCPGLQVKRWKCGESIYTSIIWVISAPVRVQWPQVCALTVWLFCHHLTRLYTYAPMPSSRHIKITSMQKLRVVRICSRQAARGQAASAAALRRAKSMASGRKASLTFCTIPFNRALLFRRSLATLSICHEVQGPPAGQTK